MNAHTNESQTPCPICGATMEYRFTQRLLYKYDVTYHHCRSCGLLQTQPPYWLDEAYATSIARVDTGILQRNLGVANVVAALAWFLLDPHAPYVDVAGGYGILTRLARDLGLDFYWVDKFTPNLLAPGFEAVSGTKFRAATALEVLEHVQEPVEFFQGVMADWGVRTIFFSTELYEGDPPAPGTWWYYTPSTGQHISFFQKRTLRAIADALSLRLYSHGTFHLMTDQTINPVLYALVTSRASRYLAAYARHRMTSRTWADHEALARATP